MRSLLLLLSLACLPALALDAVDGTGRRLALARPANRIVSLAPHATELLFAAGAGPRVVGVVDYSNWPPAAQRLPKVGGLSGISLEAVLRLRPDLVVVWRDGTSPRDIARLEDLGIPVFISHPLALPDVARELVALGTLAGSAPQAEVAARQYRERLTALERTYAHRRPVRVFFQIGEAPLFTVSDQSFVGSLIRLCGGINVFGRLSLPAPQVSLEAVVAARPEVIVATDPAPLRRWDAWPAVARGQRFVVAADPVSRPGPRLAEGAAELCRRIDAVRSRPGLTPP
ncbi:cobalamin-binding protein [Gulbenkiania mobilis]|uniref:cobalamin-binding protein n=1 Tax=Gulbenkiania mobilis TaxID=397457 RepID=UPI0006BBBB3F|nr:cobalamin-binding protein [Gulbenkiania mobilis]